MRQACTSSSQTTHGSPVIPLSNAPISPRCSTRRGSILHFRAIQVAAAASRTTPVVSPAAMARNVRRRISLLTNAPPIRGTPAVGDYLGEEAARLWPCLAWRSFEARVPATHQHPAARGAVSEAEVCAIVNGKADCLDLPPSTVVPHEPAVTIQDSVWLVDCILVPPIITRPNERIPRVAFPVTDAVSRPRCSNLGMRQTREPDVEHQVPATVSNDLARGDSILLPGILPVGNKNGIAGVFGPYQSIGAGGVANRVWLILFTPRVPHPEYSVGLIIKDMWTHYGAFLPRDVCFQDGSSAFPSKRSTVRAGGTANPRLAPRLSRVPQVVTIGQPNHPRTVDAFLPIGGRI